MDTREIELYYVKYGPMVLRRCRHLLQNEDSALDAMQDVFVRLCTHKDSLVMTFPSSLLFTMATNVCLNRLRTDKRRKETADDEIIMTIAHIDDAYMKIEEDQILQKIFSTESEADRTMAYMYFSDKMTLKEISGEFGLSISGVRKRLKNFQQRAKLVMEEPL